MKKNILVFGILFLLIVISFTYVKVRLNFLKNDVIEYLVEEHIQKKEIQEVEPYFDFLKSTGDYKWVVRIKLKGDKNYYHYYKDSKHNRIVLDPTR